MEESMKDLGITIRSMAKHVMSTLMGIFLLGSMVEVNVMVRDNSSGRVEKDTMVSGRMGRSTVLDCGRESKAIVT
jgi:hypothetical protein